MALHHGNMVWFNFIIVNITVGMADFLCNPCPFHYGWTAELTWVGPGFRFLSCLFLFLWVYLKNSEGKKKAYLGMNVSEIKHFCKAIAWLKDNEGFWPFQPQHCVNVWKTMWFVFFVPWNGVGRKEKGQIWIFVTGLDVCMCSKLQPQYRVKASLVIWKEKY